MKFTWFEKNRIKEDGDAAYNSIVLKKIFKNQLTDKEIIEFIKINTYNTNTLCKLMLGVNNWSRLDMFKFIPRKIRNDIDFLKELVEKLMIYENLNFILKHTIFKHINLISKIRIKFFIHKYRKAYEKNKQMNELNDNIKKLTKAIEKNKQMNETSIDIDINFIMKIIEKLFSNKEKLSNATIDIKENKKE